MGAIPNLTVTPPQLPNSLDQYGKALQLKNLLGEQQLLPLQMEEQEEKLKQEKIASSMKQLELQTQQGRSSFWANPEKYLPSDDEEPDHPQMKADPLAGFLGVDAKDPIVKQIHGMVKAGMPGNAAIADALQTLEFRKGFYAMDEQHQKVITNALTNLKTISAPILAESDANKKQKLIDDAKPGLMEWASFDPSMGQVVPSLNAGNFDQFANRIGAESEALGIKKQQQDIINPATGMSPTQEAEANKEISVQTNPKVQQGKIDVAKAEATAREQVQASMLPVLEQIKQQFADQKDARDKIESNVLKPFQDKMTDVNMAKTAIAQAATNPVAARAAIFKMVGVSQPTGSHRVLPMEFTAFKYPGGVGDQVKQKFNDFLTGEPWTPEISSAANAFIDGQAQAAQRSLNSGIDNTNALYGTTVGAGLKQNTAQPQNDFFSKFGGQARK